MIRLAIRRPVAVTMAYVGIALLGWAAWQNVPLELLPETSLPQLTVQAQWQGSSPESMEAFVTSPLEGAIQQIAGVEKITSTSQAGRATIQVEFARATDMDFARLELSERLASLQDDLPARVTPIVIPYVPREFREQQRPFLEYTVTGPYTPEALRAHVQDVIRPEITQVDGVNDVEVHGGRDRLLEIELDRARVESLGLSPQLVQQRIAELEQVKQAGLVDVGGVLRAVAIRHRAESAQDILQLPVLTNQDRIVRLRDVARVHDTYEDARQHYRIDGFPAVSFTVHKELGTNVVEAADRVKARLAAVETLHPPGTRILLDEDESEAVKTQLSDLRTRALVAAVVIFVVLLLFLGSIRSAAIVFATIAFSVLITVNLIYFGGFTLNVLTLMGIAMGFGLIVDNAIVVLENVYRRRKLGDSPEVAAERGARDVVLPILAATLTTVVVLIPFVYLQGELQVYYVPLAIVVGFSLVASLFVAFSFIPGLASRLLGNVQPDARGRAVPEIARAYAEEVVARFDLVSRRRRERWARWQPRLARALPWRWPRSAFLPWRWRPVRGAKSALTALRALARAVWGRVLSGARRVRRVVGRGRAAAPPAAQPAAAVGGHDGRVPAVRSPAPETGGGDTRPAWYIRLYAGLVGFTLRHPVVTVVLAMSMLGGSYYVFDKYVTRGILWGNWWGQDSYIDIQVRMPRGEEIERVDGLTRYFEERLKQIPEVERFVTHVYPSYSRTEVTFPDSLEVTDIPAAIKEQLLAYSHQFGGMDVRVYGYGPSFYGGGSTPPNYTIQIFGYNYEKVREIAEDLGSRLTRFSRIREVDTNSGGRYVRDKETELVLALDREQLALHGLTARDAVWQVAAATQSAAQNRPVRVAGEELQFAVKLAGSRELDLLGLQDLLLPSREGSAVRLGEVARLDERAVLSRIEREDQKYKRFVAYEFMGPSKLGDVVQEAVIGNTFLPPGYSIETGNDWRWDDEEQRQIYGVLIIAILLVFMVTAALFESLRQPLTVLLAVPMALVGVFLIFFYTGASFTREAYVGVIMMGGVVVNNAILLVDHINHLRRVEGMALEPATLRGTLERVRPILMTTTTTIVGLLPLVLFSETANENIWNALAYALIGGLASSTVLVLTVTPALYLMFERRPEARRLARRAPAGIGPALLIVLLLGMGAPAEAQGREWTVTPSQRIGVVMGDLDYEFDRILALARSEDGVVAVGQMNLQEVRFYGPDGRLVARQGRDGEGPGEYRYITDLVVCGGDRFHVYDTDLRRTTVVTSGGGVVRMYPGPLPDGRRGPYDLHCDSRGRLLASSWPMGEMEALRGGASGPYRGTQLVVLMDGTGTVRDTVGTFPSGERYLMRRPDGSAGGSGPRTFGPSTHLAIGHGRAFVGDAATATVYVYEGRGLDTLMLPVESTRIPGSDLAAYTESRVAAVDPERAPAVRRFLAEYDFPDTYPHYSDLVVDATGLLWVRSYPRPGEEAVEWLVVHPEGGQVARVVLPVAFTAMQVVEDEVLGVLVEDGVNFIQRYRLDRSPAGGRGEEG